MCGIVGYIGKEMSVPVLLESLKRLEYRGYDSAGLALSENGEIVTIKAVGKVHELEKLSKGRKLTGTYGIAHTRWATHGEPTEKNAHPHLDCNAEIAVVHNGIVENFLALKKLLQDEGHVFSSDTDTEVLAHLIEKYYQGDLKEAVRFALHNVEGTYGIAVISARSPGHIIVARNGSPLVIGIGNGENIVASDVSAILRHTDQVVYLNDQEIGVVEEDSFHISTLDEDVVSPQVEKVDWDLDLIQKGGFEHYMLKEIFEQPESLSNTLRGRIDKRKGTAHLQGLELNKERLRDADRIILTACGTAWHAALVGRYMIEELTRRPVDVEYASEMRYRNPIITSNTVVFAISQSGETADTLAAMREAQLRGAACLGICNVVGSSIARETDGGVFLHAGPEIGVASTKAFTSQVAVLALLSVFLGRMRDLSLEQGREIMTALEMIPDKVEEILKLDTYIREIAGEFYRWENAIYLGRSYNFPVALEGALKLKEVSYVHAEGYPAAEMKHGPIALINDGMPVVVIVTKDSIYSKVMSNIREVKARRGRVIAVATRGDSEIEKECDYVIPVPKTYEILSPLLTAIPLQLLAYHVAVLRGCDVDQPRNLAKSVTVE